MTYRCRSWLFKETSRIRIVRHYCSPLVLFYCFVCAPLSCNMHRYLAGVAKPAVKRVLEKRDRDNSYDKTKRKRGYLKSWETDFAWLSFDDQHSTMFCKLCRKFQATGVRGKNAFISGTDNFRPDTLRAHALSEAHKRAVGQQTALDVRPSTAPAHRAVQALNKATLDRLTHLFR